jgi:hypothetical protein
MIDVARDHGQQGTRRERGAKEAPIMKARGRSGVMSFVLAAGIVDSLALLTAVFATVVNVYGNHPLLSPWSLLLAVVMLVVLAITAVVDKP